MNKKHEKTVKRYIKNAIKNGKWGAICGFELPNGKLHIIDHMIENDGMYIYYWGVLMREAFNAGYKQICEEWGMPVDHFMATYCPEEVKQDLMSFT